MKSMCARLAQLMHYVYADDARALSRSMGYAYETTLRRALSSQDTFPDLERFTALMKSPARGGVVPNLNWLVNGVEEPLLQVRDGRVVKHLSFGAFVQAFPTVRRVWRRKR
jgi:hypothetical protein